MITASEYVKILKYKKNNIGKKILDDMNIGSS